MRITKKVTVDGTIFSLANRSYIDHHLLSIFLWNFHHPAQNKQDKKSKNIQRKDRNILIDVKSFKIVWFILDITWIFFHNKQLQAILSTCLVAILRKENDEWIIKEFFNSLWNIVLVSYAYITWEWCMN